MTQQITQFAYNKRRYTPGRGGHKVEQIVIHVADGSWDGTTSWFNDARCQVSAHYLVATDGRLARFVADADTAWQAGNFDVNRRSIGIEHEGRPSYRPWTPSLPQLKASAELVAGLCHKYSVKPGVTTIIPHSSINPNHACPGSTWPWNKYLQMVKKFHAALTPAAHKGTVVAD